MLLFSLLWSVYLTASKVVGTDSLQGSAKCDQLCISPTLSETQKERCAVWHQVQALDVLEGTGLSCEQFVQHVDVCTTVIPGLGVVCNEASRVTSVSSMPLFRIDQDSSGRRRCVCTWGGGLAPALSALKSLERVALSIPSEQVLFEGSAVNVRQALFSSGCSDAVSWVGGNLSGSIPHSWNALTLKDVDLSGNTGLTGSVPTSWISSAKRIRTRHTSLQDHLHCDIDCFDKSLLGHQRDKCGVWYQLSRMTWQDEWLPPCREYIFGGRDLCKDNWEHGLYVECNAHGRVVDVTTFPVIEDHLGYPVYPYRVGDSGGQCVAWFQGTLAKEMGAVEMLQVVMIEAPPSGVMLRPGFIRANLSKLNCSQIEWHGGNISGTIPAEWEHLQHLVLLSLDGNRGLRGSVPTTVLKVRTNVEGEVYITDTNVTMPKFGTNWMNAMCKKSQRTNGSLIVMGDMGTYALMIRIPREYFDPSVWGRYALTLDDLFFCGKNESAILQACALWAVFFLLLGGLILIRRSRRFRAVGNSTRGGSLSTSLPRTQMQRLRTLLYKLRVPALCGVVIYDLVSDVLLAYSMYPSWTTWFVMAGFALPDVILAGALTLSMFRSLQVSHVGPAMYLGLPLVFCITAIVYPVLIVVLSLCGSLGVHLPTGGLGGLWWSLDVERVVDLHSGLVACTEDVFTTVFTTIGFVLMARKPWVGGKANLYFPPWTFWLSVVGSMTHMLVAWWKALGHMLQWGNLSWVARAFTRLHQPVGPTGVNSSPHAVGLQEVGIHEVDLH